MPAKVGTPSIASSSPFSVAINNKIGDLYTTPNTQDSTYSRVFVYGTGSSATCYISFGIFTDNAGAPNALVTNSTVTLPVFTTTAGWRTAAFATPPTLAKNIKYWLAVLVGDSAGESITLQQGTGAAGQEVGDGAGAETDNYGTGLSDPWGASGATSAKKCAIYIRGRCWPATMGKRWRK